MLLIKFLKRKQKEPSNGLLLANARDGEDQPPPYTPVDSMPATLPKSHGTTRRTIHEQQWHGPAESKILKCKVEQLRRYLIELVALTFNADFDALNSTLHGNSSFQSTNSILSENERKDLLVLSRRVQRVKNQLQENLLLAIKEEDEQKIRSAILEPSRELEIFWPVELFALDLIGWYSEPLSCPILWTETIPGQWEDKGLSYSIISSLVYREAKGSLQAFRTGISHISPTVHVETVLLAAHRTCCRRVRYPITDSVDGYWYTREGYLPLHDAVRDKHEGRTHYYFRGRLSGRAAGKPCPCETNTEVEAKSEI